MKRGLSLYFDLLRCLAAFEVLLHHMCLSGVFNLPYAWWDVYGHEAVVVFFVLSGYVITFAARERDHGFEQFAVSRITRIVSVAYPAIVLTLLFDLLGRAVDPSLYTHWPMDHALLRMIAGMTFTNEIWVRVQVFSNLPYWSLGYEFWYYFLFASLAFLNGKYRYLTLGVIAALLGYRALLLFPIWMMGSWAYRETWTSRLPRWTHAALLAASLLGIAAYFAMGLPAVTGDWLASIVGKRFWHDGLYLSRFVISDTLLGVFVTMNFIAIKNFDGMLERALSWAKRPIVVAAGFSFTLYAVHQPTIYLGAAVLRPVLPPPVLPWAVGAFTMAIVIAVGSITERRRYELKPLIASLLRRALGLLPGQRSLARS